MEIQEYIQSLIQLSNLATENGLEFCKAIPLGLGEDDAPIFAHTEVCPARYHHICVTGEKRGEYIRRFILSICKLYGPDKVSFLILSPDKAYGELLYLKDADITIPLINRYADCVSALDTLREFVRMLAVEQENSPKFFLVLDGLEDVMSEGEKQTFECFKPFFDVVGASGIEIITGIDLEKSIFNSYPGAFVGHGNALVSTDVLGKADVTYVGIDSCLSLPLSVSYPDSPSVSDCVFSLNINK